MVVEGRDDPGQQGGASVDVGVAGSDGVLQRPLVEDEILDRANRAGERGVGRATSPGGIQAPIVDGENEGVAGS